MPVKLMKNLGESGIFLRQQSNRQFIKIRCYS